MNFKGDFIKKIPAKTFYAYNFLIQSDTDKIIVDLSNSGFVDKPNNTNIFHVLYFDPVSGAVKTFLPMNRVGIFLTENSLYRFNGNIFYNPPIMDTIYQVNKESLTPRYILDFKKHSKDPEVFNTKDPVKYKSFEKNGTIWEHYDFKETERYIYSMYYAIGQKWYFHVFNKKTGKSIVYNKVINDYFGQTQAKDMFFFDFPVALYKDRIVLLYQPTQILKDFNSLKKTLSKEQFEKFKQQNLQLVNMIENLKKEDNPVLGFYKFK